MYIGDAIEMKCMGGRLYHPINFYETFYALFICEVLKSFDLT